MRPDGVTTRPGPTSAGSTDAPSGSSAFRMKLTLPLGVITTWQAVAGITRHACAGDALATWGVRPEPAVRGTDDLGRVREAGAARASARTDKPCVMPMAVAARRPRTGVSSCEPLVPAGGTPWSRGQATHGSSPSA